MLEATVIPVGSGEVVGDSPERRVEILCDHDALHATWSRFAAGREGADLHVHRRHTDLFYVLDGELTVRLGTGGEGVVVPAGTLARVPPLVVHGFRNGSDADVLYLNLHAPGQGFAAFLRALRDGRNLTYDQEPPPADGGRPVTEAVVGGHLFVSERPGRRTVLLADADAIGVAEVRLDPWGPSVPPHVHDDHAESLFVLEGEVALTAGRRELRVEAGSLAQVPQGDPHSLSFPGSGTAHYLEMHTPSRGFGAFVRALHDAEDEQAGADNAAFDLRPARLPG
jgi:mannose-6-phosphate isomerase-like protein (cupin superfamily)